MVKAIKQCSVALASPIKVAHLPRLVVIATLVRSQSLLGKWNGSAPPDALHGSIRRSSA